MNYQLPHYCHIFNSCTEKLNLMWKSCWGTDILNAIDHVTSVVPILQPTLKEWAGFTAQRILKLAFHQCRIVNNYWGMPQIYCSFTRFPSVMHQKAYKVFQKPSGRVGVVKQASLTNVKQFVKQCCRIAVKPIVCGIKNVQVWFHSFNQEFYMPIKTNNCSIVKSYLSV